MAFGDERVFLSPKQKTENGEGWCKVKKGAQVIINKQTKFIGSKVTNHIDTQTKNVILSPFLLCIVYNIVLFLC